MDSNAPRPPLSTEQKKNSFFVHSGYVCLCVCILAGAVLTLQHKGKLQELLPASIQSWVQTTGGPPFLLRPPQGRRLLERPEELRWCLREHIVLEAVRPLLLSKKGRQALSARDTEYMNRCLAPRDSKALALARKDIAARRKSILLEARSEAECMEQGRPFDRLLTEHYAANHAGNVNEQQAKDKEQHMGIRDAQLAQDAQNF